MVVALVVSCHLAPTAKQSQPLAATEPRLTHQAPCDDSSLMPSTVGIREAKANLSRLVKRAATGDCITITEHGRPVARLVPVEDDSLSVEQRLMALETRGWITKQTAGKLPPIIEDVADGLAQRRLREDRDAR